MVEILKSLSVVAVGIIGFIAVLGGLYWLASQLPEPWRERARVAVFVGPALILLVGGLIIPSIVNLRLSFYTGNGLSPTKWYGLGNFRDIFTNDDNLMVLRNTVWWVLVVTAASVVIGIIIARFADKMRGEPIAKALIFLPTAISMVGAGVIWNFMYATKGNDPDKQFGLITYFWMKLDPILPGHQGPNYWLQDKRFFGIDSNWLPGVNTFFIMAVIVWIQAGFATVVISAALKGVPDDLVEAAKIDGATERQAFFKVVLPYVKGTIITVATTILIAVMKIFDIIQTMGKGGSFGTSTIANEMYEQSFTQDNKGRGAAWAVLLFLAVIPIVFINSRNQRAMREGR
ncbi:MAG: sugar ABC transporter permease [Actinomycetota bacterium]|nr:sugar ABC transporter permease [Actinomycetota bacterium]